MCTKSEFDIFVKKPVQSAVISDRVCIYKPIASVDQNVLEFVIPSDNESYIDLNVKLMIKGKLTKLDGTEFDQTDFTGVVNNLLHSLFSQCSITLNGTSVTASKDLYHYRSYLETLLTYGTDAAKTHLTTGFWYVDTGNVLGVADPKAAADANTNMGFNTRYNLMMQSKELELFGNIHADIFNVSTLLIPGVQIHVKLDKSKSEFYLLSTKDDAKAVFKFSDAALYVRHVKPNPSLFIAHTQTLKKANARYDITKVALKTFTFSSGTRSLSIDNAVLGPLPKRLLFCMIKNTDFTGSVNTNPYNFQHFKINNFVMYVNGQQIPTGGLAIGTGHEKTTTMAYQTLFSGSGIHHGNAGIQITHDMFIKGYFMLLFDLTPDSAASEGHTSLPENGNIRIEAKFDSALTSAITCLLYLEYDANVQIDNLRNVITDF